MSRAGWKIITIDLDSEITDVPTDGCDHLFVTAVASGVPLGGALLKVEGQTYPAHQLADDLSRRFGHEHLRQQLLGALLERPLPPEHLTISVMVCTRDRPDDLDRCLEAIGNLSLRPDDVIVVDNGSRSSDTARVAASHGYRCVLEPQPGLDRARNRGVLESTTDLVLCTDDDACVHPEWASRLRECFTDPLVAAATGLVLPALLDNAARQRFELFAGFSRGHRRRVLDGTVDSPYRAGVLGAGASMAFRTAFLREIGGFPEELDAGMPTGSGGDTYALAEVLRCGFRVVYEPAALAYHRHRATEQELKSTLRGYGNGIASWLTSAGVRHRDPAAALVGGRHMLSYLGNRAQQAAKGPRNDPARSPTPGATIPRDLVRAELRGLLDTPKGWRTARQRMHDRGELLSPLPGRGSWLAPSQNPPIMSVNEWPRLSAVIPTRGRRESVVRLMRSLEQQDYPRDRLEVVVVVDGDIDGTAAALHQLETPWPLHVTVLESPSNDPNQGNGAAVARTRGAEHASGQVVVFFDDDVSPVHQRVLASHAAAHSNRRGVRIAAVGPCRPTEVDPAKLTAISVRNWWVEHAERLERPTVKEFSDFGTGNVSIDLATFRELGGFLDMRRREDWEFGYRFRKAGHTIVGLRNATVLHDSDTDLRNAIDDRFREAHGDIVFAHAHPEIISWIPLGNWEAMTGRHRRVALWAIDHTEHLPMVVEAATRMLDLYERLGLIEEHRRLMNLAYTASYWAGVGDAVGGLAGWTAMRQKNRTRNRALLDLSAPQGWEPPQPGSADEVLVTHGSVALGVVPIGWGGVPWDRQRFVERVVDSLAWNADLATVAPDAQLHVDHAR